MLIAAGFDAVRPTRQALRVRPLPRRRHQPAARGPAALARRRGQAVGRSPAGTDGLPAVRRQPRSDARPPVVLRSSAAAPR
ncbi:MAG: hypothetical protein MZV70_64390 [Desulfobacterales bacterium]|nr:hypothetical protein [Desulfobacterales bacterium]